MINVDKQVTTQSHRPVHRITDNFHFTNDIAKMTFLSTKSKGELLGFSVINV